MLRQTYQGKSIVILGVQSVVGRVLIKQLISCIGQQHICAIEMGQDKSKRDKFQHSSYFSTKEQQYLASHLEYVPLEQVASRFQAIDIDLLISLFVPVDFSLRSKIIDMHVLATIAICKEFSQVVVKHCVQLSSIYVHEPGYVPENEEASRTIGIFKFGDRKGVAAYLDETFETDKEAWRWSIRFIEENYMSLAQRVDVVRLPALGPTLSSNEGYATKFNYFTYLLYQMGTGLVRNVEGLRQNIVDVIPADFVANYVLVLGSKQAGKTWSTHNLSTSSRNPLTVCRLVEFCSEAWQEYENRSIAVRITEQKWQKALLRLKDRLPGQAKHRLGQLFDIPSWRIESQKDTIEQEQRRKLIKKYEYFLSHEWICESNNSIDLFFQLDAETQSRCNFNVNSINWPIYIRLCCFAIKRHLLNQPVEEFKSTSSDMLSRKTSSYFSDLVWAFSEGKEVEQLKAQELKKYVLSTNSVKHAVANLVETRMKKVQNTPIAYQKAEEQMYQVANAMCQQMFSDYSMGSIRMFAWFLHKVFRQIYEKVVIDKEAMARLRQHNEKTNGPLIIIPTHRSYIDFLIMGYVFFGYGIKLPYIAAAEDFLSMAIVHILLRRSGAFFIKRNQLQYRQLYKAIMLEYISKLLIDGNYLQFFIEGTRSRVGKMLAPKFGILSILVQNVVSGKIPDASILPVTINYEKILEGNSFTYEMMGEAKVKESLSRLLKAANVLKENYGRIYIQVCDTISVKRFFNQRGIICKSRQISQQPGKQAIINEQNTKEYKAALEQLGRKVVLALSDNVVVTAPAVLASIVLMNRKGISDDTLTEKVGWLCRQVASRGVKIARSQHDFSISISNTLGLLGDVMTKTKKDMYEVQLSFDQDSFIKLFTLTYYRNTLTHIFFQESLLLTAMASFGLPNITLPKITAQELWHSSKFLATLLVYEFYLRHCLEDRQRFDVVLTRLVNKGILVVQDGNVMTMVANENHFSFCCSLIWPVVESYWITCLYLFKLKQSSSPMAMGKFLMEIQWFAQSLINQRIISHAEAISSDTIKNAVAVFTSMQMLKLLAHDHNGVTLASVKVVADESVLKRLQQRIQVYLKSSFAKSVKGILESGQGSVILDFPFLSKL